VEHFRTILLAATAVVTIVVVAIVLGHKEAPTDDPGLPGAWQDGPAHLELLPGGAYWTAATESDGRLILVECGAWHATAGEVRMKAAWTATAPRVALSPTVLLDQPGFRMGTYVRTGDALTLELLRAVPTHANTSVLPKTTSHFSRSPVRGARALDQAENRVLHSSCGISGGD
jgi:hypothetical protein